MLKILTLQYLIITFMILAISQSTTKKSKTINMTSDLTNYQYKQLIFATQNQYVTITMNLPSRSYYLLSASFTQYYTRPDLSSLYGLSPKSLNNIDLEGFRMAKSQYINLIVNQNLVNQIFIKIFDFNPQYLAQNISFFVTVQYGKYIKYCQLCYSPSVISSTSCYCTNCTGNFKGYDCSVNYQTLIQQYNQTKIIYQNKFYYYEIYPRKSQLQIQITSNGQKIQVYIQEIKNQTFDYASFANVMFINGREAKYRLNFSTQKLNINLISQYPLSIVLITYENAQALVNIKYYYPSNSLYTPILAGIGGFLLILIIGVIVICIIKRRIHNQGLLVDYQNRRIRTSSNNILSKQQLDRFFPQYSQDMLSGSSEQLFFQQILQTKNAIKQQIQKDCIICLCLIKNNELKRLTYCKHQFHSLCLIQWFDKNRNCPYCRKEFDRKNTIKLYEKVLNKSRQDKLQGLNLIKQILNQNKNQQQNFVKGSIELLNDIGNKATIDRENNNNLSGQFLNQNHNNEDSLIIDLQNQHYQ